MSEPIKRKEVISPALRSSQLQIHAFGQHINNGDDNDEGLEQLQDQLRIKDKWQLLKEKHNSKMDKVQESAIRRKNMFTSHTVKHQQKQISQNHSVEKLKQNITDI